MSTLNVATIKSKTALTPPAVQDLNGIGIGTFCRAWVNFNGTGTVAIRAAFNVTSITDNGVGDYTVNFTNAMPDANYAVVGSNIMRAGEAALGLFMISTTTAMTTSLVRVRTFNPTTVEDFTMTNVAIFR